MSPANEAPPGSKTHVEVFLNPGVGGVPVLEAVVAVRVAPGEVFLGNLAGGEVGFGGEISGDALQDLWLSAQWLLVSRHTKRRTFGKITRQQPTH